MRKHHISLSICHISQKVPHTAGHFSAMPGKRDKEMDIVFVLDATGSMAYTIAAACDKVADLAFDLRNRTVDVRYAAICYRDPVDTKDRHEVFDLTDNAELLSSWLEGIAATGGGDGPEDFVGALQLAFNNITWREGSKRALIWIADAPAHGRRYCGFDNHQEEEPKLEPLVASLGDQKFYFVGMSLNGGANVSFAAMKAIYEAHGGPSFVIESFKPDPGNEIGRIADTMVATTTSTVKAAFGIA
jgi:Mg-chelatase subunit ChlD